MTLGAILLLAAGPVLGETGNAYDALLEQFGSVPTGQVVAATVSQFPFQRDCATFVLEEGQLFLFPAFGGGRHLALFAGKARFLFAPPLGLERAHLQRTIEAPHVDTATEHLFFFFADETAAQLQRAFSFAPVELERSSREFLERTLVLLRDSAGEVLPTGLATVLLNRDRNDYFYASVETRELGHLVCEISPYRSEEVSLERRRRTIGATIGRKLEMLSLFHRVTDYELGLHQDYRSDVSVHVTHYAMEVALDRGLNLSATADLTIETKADSLRWFHLQLHPSLAVDSLSFGDGRTVDHWRAKDSWELWVAADPPLVVGSPLQLRVAYHGDVIERTGDWITLKSSLYWYPHATSRERATFHVTYQVPEEFTLVSAGQKTFEELRDHRQVSRWELVTPSRNFSFVLGFFKLFTVEDDRIPPVAIYMSKSHHREIGEALIEEGIVSGRGMEKQVGADVANAMAFFQHVYGPYPGDHLRAAEIPRAHGEAFPGLLQLSWATFQTESDEGFNEIFRAHEVAHQWWGFGVDFESYHDQWLSEGFAEYSGLWYMQNELGDNDRFFRHLREWRDRIFDNREYTIGRGRDAGPIWLGYRTRSLATSGDYDLIVYRKGAWVLHMLRNMLLDLDTMSEDGFINMMRDFYTRYRGREASTENFQEVAAEHLGMDMEWFFDQWYFGTALPTYEYAYRITAESGGRYTVSLQVHQRDVPEDFRVYMPIYVDFGDERFARVRVVLTGAESQFDLPPMPIRPREIHLNDMESVLCRVKKVDWRD